MDGGEESSTLLQPEITTEVWDDLFTSSSEDESRVSETVELSITQAHRDPLEECMDGVEAFVHSVLKTGKVTVSGEAADLTKLHSIMFGLQATEKELPQLLPQLLQHPLFSQNPPLPVGDEMSYKVCDYLEEGHLQVGVHMDTLIYHLLHSHCCSQAKQAEQLIETTLTNTTFTSSSTELGPPLIFASSLRRPQQPPPTLFPNPLLPPRSGGSAKSTSSSSIGSERVGSERSHSQSSYVSISSADENMIQTDTLSPISESSKDFPDDLPPSSAKGGDQKREAELKKESASTSGKGKSGGVTGSLSSKLAQQVEQCECAAPTSACTTSSSTSTTSSTPTTPPITPPNTITATTPSTSSTFTSTTLTTSAFTSAAFNTSLTPSSSPTNPPSSALRNPTLKKAMSEEKRGTVRKTSVVSIRSQSVKSSKSSDSDDDIGHFAGGEKSSHHSGCSGSGGGGGGRDQWHVYSPDPKDLIIATYGDNAYPLLMWDPTFKVEFKLSSSLGILSGSVVALEPSKPTVTVKVKNPTALEVGFSVRAYRQTALHKMHVVHPTHGLHKMGPFGHWEDNADFMSSEVQEFFVLDLFICTLTGTPMWNVMRKYAVMKAVNKSTSNANTLTVSKPRRFTHFQLPGTGETKEQNLKAVIAQGLQCVIKDKLVPAEIIFTQAKLLPDFQRLPLKAFVHICLAVIANKKSKERHGLQPMIAHSNCVTKLLDICDSSPAHVKMPKMITLVKQLKKELNLEKLIKDNRKKEKQRIQLQRSNNSSFDVDSEGGRLSLTNEGMTLEVFPGALSQEAKITMVTTDIRQLQSMLFTRGWDQTIVIIAAVEVHSSPPIEQFNSPVELTVTIPPHHSHLLQGNPKLCLMHSKYMRHWQDITTDTACSISIIKDVGGENRGEGGIGGRICIKTDQVGFLAVTWVNLDPCKISQIAMRSLVAEPAIIQISVFAEHFLDDNVAQLVISIQPCKPHGEPINTFPVKPRDHTPISFPHTVQAFAGERLRLTIVGHFEAHEGYGQNDLNVMCDVNATINQMFEKWVKVQVGKPLSGKLLVTTCRTPGGAYETLAEINLSSRTGVRCSSSSS